MAGINKVILVGNVGQVNIRDGQTSKVANYSVATSEKYKGKDGQYVEQTEWHNCVAFGKLAEIVESYVKKGDRIYCEGKIKTEKYTGKDGLEKTSHKIIVHQIQMLGGKKDDAPQNDYQKGKEKDGWQEFGDEVPF